jgi:hypothetical protein
MASVGEGLTALTRFESEMLMIFYIFCKKRKGASCFKLAPVFLFNEDFAMQQYVLQVVGES